MNDFYGTQVVLNEGVKYIGDGEDPADNLWMKAYIKALKEFYQPERLNPEASKEDVIV
jgi:hypothetical protein